MAHQGVPDEAKKDVFHGTHPRSFENLDFRAPKKDAPLMNDGDIIAQTIHLAHDVSRKQDGLANGSLRLNEMENLPPHEDVQVSRRFIEDDDRRIMNHAPRNVHLLPLTGRETAAGLVEEFLHSKNVGEAIDAILECRTREAIEASKKMKQLGSRGPLIQAGGPREEADVRAHLAGLFRDIESTDKGAPTRGPQHRRKNAQGRCLACAILTEKAEHAARPTLEAHAIQGPNETALAILKGLLQIRDEDPGH
jgi:hypothetical protein